MLGVTSKAEGAAPQNLLVAKEREIVMDVVMAVSMMEIVVAIAVLSVEAIIVFSLDYIIMRKTTVVRSRQPSLPQQPSQDNRSNKSAS